MKALVVISCLVVSSFFVVSSSFAQVVDLASNCIVRVRTVKASESMQGGEAVRADVSGMLSDVSMQLKSLPFSSYEVIDSKEKSLSLNELRVFDVVGLESQRHKVTVEPHFVSKRRVQVTVDWKSPSGESLLSTKLKVLNDKNVVLGSDGSGSSSMILCVRINCS